MSEQILREKVRELRTKITDIEEEHYLREYIDVDWKYKSGVGLIETKESRMSFKVLNWRTFFWLLTLNNKDFFDGYRPLSLINQMNEIIKINKDDWMYDRGILYNEYMNILGFIAPILIYLDDQCEDD